MKTFVLFIFVLTLLGMGLRLFAAVYHSYQGNDAEAATNTIHAFVNFGIMAWSGLLLWGDKL